MRSVPLLAVALSLLAGCAHQPEKPEYYAIKEQADAAYKEGDYQKALEKYRIVVDEVPAEAGPWFRLGNVHTKLGRPDAAIAAYQEALVREPGLGKAWNNMGVVHLRQAVNAYMQLCQHAEPGDRLCQRAQRLVDGINALLTGAAGRPDSVPQPAEAAAPARTRTERDAPEPAPEERLEPESRSATQPAPKTARDEPFPAGPAATAPVPKEPSSVATSSPDAPALRDLEWLAQQAPDAFFVQLSSGFASGPLLRLAQRFNLSGDDHHVFTAANSSGRPYFQLLHGPFTDYDAARAAVEALPPPLAKLDPTIRRAGSLQALRGLEAAGAPSQ